MSSSCSTTPGGRSPGIATRRTRSGIPVAATRAPPHRRPGPRRSAARGPDRSRSDRPSGSDTRSGGGRRGRRARRAVAAPDLVAVRPDDDRLPRREIRRSSAAAPPLLTSGPVRLQPEPIITAAAVGRIVRGLVNPRSRSGCCRAGTPEDVSRAEPPATGRSLPPRAPLGRPPRKWAKISSGGRMRIGRRETFNRRRPQPTNLVSANPGEIGAARA